jgi:hypothetical protein
MLNNCYISQLNYLRGINESISSNTMTNIVKCNTQNFALASGIIEPMIDVQ